MTHPSADDGSGSSLGFFQSLKSYNRIELQVPISQKAGQAI
jgi:hypothetical protein